MCRLVAGIAFAACVACTPGAITGSGEDPDDQSTAPDTSSHATPGQELVSGAGRIRGGGIVMEVQIGHFVTQRETTDGTRRIHGNAVVKR
jgi:hypothetical protein